MPSECTKETFLQDVANHRMNVLRDDGIYRHLKFRSTKCGWNQWFEIVTWPGTLVLHGDMGSWTFSRVEDMFTFFRGERINQSYWAEKLEACDKNTDYKEFDPDAFKADVISSLDNWSLSDVERSEVLEALDEQVFEIDSDQEYPAYDALLNFERHGVRFDGCDIPSGKRYSYRFVWCLWAIVWGIQQYDKGQQ